MGERAKSGEDQGLRDRLGERRYAVKGLKGIILGKELDEKDPCIPLTKKLKGISTHYHYLSMFSVQTGR